MKFEWKISEAGNSGIKYRTIGPLGPEYQILDDHRHRDSRNSKRRAASIYDLFPASENKEFRPSGHWNSGRIIANGDHIEHWLNGNLVTKAKIGSPEWEESFQKSKYRKHDEFGRSPGPILIQDHFDEVWLRNVLIREL